MRPTEHELAQDHRADDLRERDRQREPQSIQRAARQSAIREAFAVGVETIITELPCPVCRADVYVPADSDREWLECEACGAVLVTRRGIDGLVAIDADVGGDA